MSHMEDVELLKAAMSLAIADGQVTRGEWGIIERLAARAGVGRVSLDAMLARAESDPTAKDELFTSVRAKGPRALKLLVATARLDGEISPEERELLVEIAGRLDITGAQFDEVYSAGIAAADAKREQKG
jgi:tellurite resistance protein